MALSADTQPHFSTIAGFISSMSDEVSVLFRDVLLYYDEMGLIGRELFAIDGCKLPSNASKTSIEQYFRFYNTERRHQALDRHTPDALYFGGRNMPKAA